MEISVVITAWKEDKSIPKAVNSIVNPKWNDYKGEFEVIVVCPDEETWKAAEKTAQKYGFENIRRLKDPQKGKPFALNMAIKDAKGKILILTDGDVYFSKDSIRLLTSHFKDREVGAVTGRPVSIHKKDNFWGYLSHLFVDAAHHKRLSIMSSKDRKSKKGFFVLSGYMLAMRNIGIKSPSDCLIEDAYFSYEIYNKGMVLRYEPEAKVYVKYPNNVRDWYKQKLRSVGGYVQLKKYDVIKDNTKERNMWTELEYFLFPIEYAKGIREVFWSLLMYPLRLSLWIMIFYERKIKRKSFKKTWVRIESTK